jgi:hypothetical protein
MGDMETPLGEGGLKHRSNVGIRGTFGNLVAGGMHHGHHLTTKTSFTDLSGWERLSSYKTAKLQVIEDPVLAITFRVIQLLVVIYAINTVLLKHSFQKIGQPTGACNTYTHNSGQNFTPADDTALCPPGAAGNASSIVDYACDKNFVFDNFRCKQYEGLELFTKGTARAQNPNQMFITTFVEEHYARTADRAEAYMHYFPPAVEKGIVVIVGAFELPEEYRGLLDSSISTKDRQVKLLSTNTLPVEVVNGERIGKTEFSDAAQVQLTLSELLQLATMDDGRPFDIDAGNPADGPQVSAECPAADRLPEYRITGLKLAVTFELSNIGGGLWSALTGAEKFKIKLRVKDIPTTWVSTGPQPVYKGGAMDHDETRYGVQLLLSVTGSVGRFDFATMCSSFTSLLVMMMLATMATDFTMMNLRGARSVSSLRRECYFLWAILCMRKVLHG